MSIEMWMGLRGVEMSNGGCDALCSVTRSLLHYCTIFLFGIILKNTCIILCLLPTLFIIQCTVFLFFNNYGIQYGSYGMLWYGMEGVREVCYCCNSFMYWYQYNMVALALQYICTRTHSCSMEFSAFFYTPKKNR
jgi:hypothetical protein